VSERALAFGRVAERYERGRPPYAEEALDWIAERLPLHAVLDLGAGTGKLARQLVARGAHVVAVEPDGAMREVFTRELQDVEIRAGTAESIPVEDGSVDVVAAGESFHWFDTVAAEREIHRVLRPGGGVALLWKPWSGDPVLDAVDAIVGDVAQHRERSTWRDEHDRSLFGAIEERAFREERPITVGGLVDWALSSSTAATAGEDRQRRIERQLHTLLPTGAGTVSIPTEVAVFDRA
jgi:SAM-dependent methyltransferase